MHYTTYYTSPLGKILLSADDIGITGLWFEGQKHFACILGDACEEKALPLFANAKHWLDTYFAGDIPAFDVPLHLTGTAFQNRVWTLLRSIPYGKTVSYGDVAKRVAVERGISQMSARAVGNAVAVNRISILVPCHRVIGANGSLTGYAGGLERKIALLDLEKQRLQSYM